MIMVSNSNWFLIKFNDLCHTYVYSTNFNNYIIDIDYLPDFLLPNNIENFLFKITIMHTILVILLAFYLLIIFFIMKSSYKYEKISIILLFLIWIILITISIYIYLDWQLFTNNFNSISYYWIKTLNKIGYLSIISITMSVFSNIISALYKLDHMLETLIMYTKILINKTISRKPN
jgi:hypothetical protein